MAVPRLEHATECYAGDTGHGTTLALTATTCGEGIEWVPLGTERKGVASEVAGQAHT
jgi:hypothetical protein